MQLGEKRYFDEDGRLTEYGIYIYARLRLRNREEELPLDLLDKVSDDPETAERVILKYNHLKKQRSAKILRVLSRVAAAVLLLAIMGSVFVFFEDEHQQPVSDKIAGEYQPKNHEKQNATDKIIFSDGDTNEPLAVPRKANDDYGQTNLAPGEETQDESRNNSLSATESQSAVSSSRERIAAIQESRFSFEEQIVFERGLRDFAAALRSSSFDSLPTKNHPKGASRSAFRPHHNQQVWDDELVFDWENPDMKSKESRFVISIKQQGRPVQSFECGGPPCSVPDKLLIAMKPGLYYWDVYDKHTGMVIAKNKFRFYRSDYPLNN